MAACSLFLARAGRRKRQEYFGQPLLCLFISNRLRDLDNRRFHQFQFRCVAPVGPGLAGYPVPEVSGGAFYVSAFPLRAL